MRQRTWRGRPGRPPRRRRAISTGTGIFLIAAGAILLFAVSAGTSPLNWHIVGVILIIVGVLGLLLPPTVRVRREPGPSPSAGLAPAGLAPDELPPDELAPDELAPDELAPDELAPDELPPESLSRSIWPSFRRKRLAEIRRESAEDAAAMRDDGTFISPDAPAHQEDDL